MPEIQAVVVSADQTLQFAPVAAPQPQPNEAVVTVKAISLNRGEVRRAGVAAVGWRPGWDLAGTIAIAAADGSGPAVGTRVVGFVAEGAWAEQVGVPTHALATLPDAVSFSAAATLPVAGLTAYHVLAKGGSLLGRRVLVTAASGGVGLYLVQLAKLAGAEVTAHLRQATYTDLLTSLGADQVAIGSDLSQASGYYDLIADSVGGPLLGDALGRLNRDGILVSFGTTAGREVTFNAGNFYGGGPRTLYGFILFQELRIEPASVGLERLVRFLAAGQLKPHIGYTGAWTEIATVAHALSERQFVGKAVLTLP